jgi:hypothetical protein
MDRQNQLFTDPPAVPSQPAPLPQTAPAPAQPNFGMADDGYIRILVPPGSLPKREPGAVLTKLRATFTKALEGAKTQEPIQIYMIRRSALVHARQEFALTITKIRELTFKHGRALDAGEACDGIESELVAQRSLQETLALRESHLAQAVPGAHLAAQDAWAAISNTLVRAELDRARKELADLEARVLIVPLSELLAAVLDALDALQLLASPAALVPMLPAPPRAEPLPEPAPLPLPPPSPQLPLTLRERLDGLPAALTTCSRCGYPRSVLVPVVNSDRQVILRCLACYGRAERGELSDPWGKPVAASAIGDVLLDVDTLQPIAPPAPAPAIEPPRWVPPSPAQLLAEPRS